MNGFAEPIVQSRHRFCCSDGAGEVEVEAWPVRI